MTEARKQQYDIYINTEATGILCAANAVLVEHHKRLHICGFRYTKQYLEHQYAFPLDPVQLPLEHKEFTLNCSAGILDDYLPDHWGRKVLSHLAFYRDKQKLNTQSCIDMLSVLHGSRIGALQWVIAGTQPTYTLGTPYDRLEQAEAAAQNIDEVHYTNESVDEVSLLYLANAGTGVGGARPKALICKDNKGYLAKFNRIHKDDYNNARVELACLKIAQQAGIHCYDGNITRGINNREVLMLERFDIGPVHTNSIVPVASKIASL